MSYLSHPKDRLQWIIDTYYKGHPKRLADRIGVSPATMSQILSGRAFPSWKVLSPILSIHTDINPDWFINNIGERKRLIKSGGKGTVDMAIITKFIREMKEALDD